jgi:hypothetical protein
MTRILSLGLLALLWTCGSANAETISLESLLDEMVTRDNLARVPEPAYTCRQFSSYDRDAVAVDQPGWFANWDRSQFIRTEENDGRKEYVLLDAAGPGAIVRFWATWHGPQGKEFTNGTLRVYLDGQEKPAIEGPIADVLDQGALVGEPLSKGVSPETEYRYRGHNLYLPIPYGKHCKITYETSAPVDRGAKKGEALYYQINYRTYEGGTRVKSFTMDQLKQLAGRIDEAQKQLVNTGVSTDQIVRQDSITATIAAGESQSATLDGPGAIRQLTINLKADDLAQALRSTILEITFDGQRTVWCPVGEFFGIGYKFNPYKTWYTEVLENGDMNCFWVMPFKESCDLTLHNLGDQTVELVNGEASWSPWSWDERSMYFHATWHQLTKATTRGRKSMDGQGAYDVNYVEVKGKGTFVGDTLTVFNGARAWWGEGDEKIFVDGESFPSHFGTGTEDYYGYAWCKPAFFESPFHAQPDGRGNLDVGFSVNSRYRALDAIPFTEQIKFDMELWHWADTQVNYAPATFWYARPGATCNVSPDAETAAKPVALQREDVVEVFKAENAIEGEVMKIIEKTGGTTEIQEVGQFRWSDDSQLWWRDGKAGDRLVLTFPVAKAGRYKVSVNLTKAVDYGIVKVTVNDTASKEFDRFHSTVAHDKLELGTIQLPAGTNRLTVELTGINEQAVKKYMFGLDYLELVPVQ